MHYMMQFKDRKHIFLNNVINLSLNFYILLYYMSCNIYYMSCKRLSFTHFFLF